MKPCTPRSAFAYLHLRTTTIACFLAFIANGVLGNFIVSLVLPSHLLCGDDLWCCLCELTMVSKEEKSK